MVPKEADLRRAAEVLNAGERVAILVGQGALHATDEVIEVAEILGAGVAKALLGRAVLPDDLSFVTGSIGLLGTRPSYELMMGCDTLLMVGSNFPYSEFLPEEGQARGVQIDIDGKMLGIRYPMEVHLEGDSAETLRALAPLLRRKEDRSWRERIEASIRDWWDVVEERSMSSADPINPERVLWELSPRLPDNCIISADSGSVANWFARNMKIRRGMKATLSGTLATMCPAVPYALAAKFNYPDRVAIALVGDGAMQMLGNNCLITAAKYWERWSDPRMVVMVLNNQDLNMVTWEQRVLAGDPKWETSQNLMDFPYAAYAEMLGLRGYRVEKPDEVGPAWDEALRRRPAVRARHQDRPQGAAAAAARHLRAGQEVHPGPAQGRPGSGRHHLAVVQGEHAGRPAVVARRAVASRPGVRLRARLRQILEGQTMKGKLISEDAQRTYAVILDTGDEAVRCLTAFAKEHGCRPASSRRSARLATACSATSTGRRRTTRASRSRSRWRSSLSLATSPRNDGEPKLHPHVVVGKADGTAHGGHLLEAHVRPTLEVIITESPDAPAAPLRPGDGPALIRL